jgi:sugar O-acyltransferase (sialic acid O-acetyltransferase NeuD family)
MSRIIIVGAGDFARELESWIHHDDEFSKGADTFFIDDDSRALEKFPRVKDRLLSPIHSFTPQIGDRMVLGVSNPKLKQVIVELFLSNSIELTTFIHHSVITAEDSVIGRGSVMCPGSVVSVGARIGSFVTVNLHATIGHDARIGDYSSLMSHVDVTGRSVLGKGVFMGSHSIVLPGVIVEEGATVGSGSVAIRRVAQGSTVFGVPARIISNYIS